MVVPLMYMSGGLCEQVTVSVLRNHNGVLLSIVSYDSKCKPIVQISLLRSAIRSWLKVTGSLRVRLPRYMPI